MPESEADLALLLRAARAGGEVAMAHVAVPLDITDKPDGAGPVTQADLAVNARLSDVLRTERPDYGWLSEESAHDPHRAAAPATFVIDPIDGTRSFIGRERTWAISIAVVRDGRPVAVVVHMPAMGFTYSASAGGGAHRDDRPLQASRAEGLAKARVLATKPSMRSEHWEGDPPELHRSHRPSLAYRLCLVAEGRFDAMFTFRPSWEWDIAAGALICAEAGATVTDSWGAPLVFNSPEALTPGVICAAPGLHDALMARRPRP